MRDSLTFTQALNLLKQPSDNSTRSSRTLKHETFQQIKSESKLPTIFSPKPKTVKRTNTTLKHIFREFGQQPNNLYVLRLGTASKQSAQKNFDEWIHSAEVSKKGIAQGYDGDQTINQKNRFNLKEQIQKQIQKIRHKVSPVQASQKAKEKDESSGEDIRNDKNKFSFSNFYLSSEETSFGSKDQVITKISIMEDEVVQEEVEYVCGEGKENEDPNFREEVRGLQFSKNRRYKTCKKKRKYNKA